MAASFVPELSIVLLNFDRLELTRKTVKNILQTVEGVDFELILVDNNSTDGTREYLQQLKDSRVRLILNDINLYFGGGLNSGLDECKGDFVLLTQNDMTFGPHSIRNLIDLHKLLPKAGCSGFGGGFINSAGGIFETSDWWQNPLRRFDYLPVDFVSGCCMLFERNLINRHDIKFDVQFRLYWEDVDISHQVKSKGYDLNMINNNLLGIRHLRSGTITPLLGVEERERIRKESEFRYQKKWASFYKDPNNMVQGIKYSHFFRNMRIITDVDLRLPQELVEHKDDANDVATLEFQEFQGNFENAIAGYRNIIKENPNNFMAYRNLCRIVSKKGDFQSSRKIVAEFKECLEKTPPVVLRQQLFTYVQSALLKIARVNVEEKNYRAAFKYYDELQQIAQTAPTIALCEIEKAKMKYLMGFYSESEPEMKMWLQKNQFLDLEPMMYTAAHFYLGEMAFKRKEIDVAVDRYHRALSIDPGHERAKERLKELEATGGSC
jgi:GT2 family glycosyltransferase